MSIRKINRNFLGEYSQEKAKLRIWKSKISKIVKFKLYDF